MLIITITKATAKNKKWRAQFSDQTPSVNFGDDRYEDFTTHHDKQRMQRYIQRHKKDPHDPKTAGELSRVLLWSRPDWIQAKKNFERLHSVKLIWRR